MKEIVGAGRKEPVKWKVHSWLRMMLCRQPWAHEGRAVWFFMEILWGQLVVERPFMAESCSSIHGVWHPPAATSDAFTNGS